MEKVQVTKIRNKGGDITTGLPEIKKKYRKHEQLYVNKPENRRFEQWYTQIRPKRHRPLHSIAEYKFLKYTWIYGILPSVKP